MKAPIPNEGDARLEADRAEALDALFERAAQGLPRCPQHPDFVLYQDGCSQCRHLERLHAERGRPNVKKEKTHAAI